MAEEDKDKSDQNKDQNENQDQNEDKGSSPEIDLKDSEAVNQRLGELQKTVKDFDDYKKRVEPILQAIYSDPATYKAVNESYQKLMGVLPKKDEDKKEDDNTKEENKGISKDNTIENDNRNALITQAVQGWEQKHGIDKLKPEEKAALNTKVLGELKILLDPANTGKSGADLLSGVPVARVSDYLERAYFFATREERETQIKDTVIKERQDAERGLIGGISSSSITEDQVALTEKEKAIAKKQGITEEKYLANKKEILKRKGSIA